MPCGFAHPVRPCHRGKAGAEAPGADAGGYPGGQGEGLPAGLGRLFPRLRAKQIDGVQFLDGGYRDNMPTALAQKMGAEELVCVDLEGVGITLPTAPACPPP